MLGLLALIVPVQAIARRLDNSLFAFFPAEQDLVVLDGWILRREDLKRIFPDAA
jgi:hypothetical protein